MSGHEPELPRLLAGRYYLDVKLGQGGMGVVYGGVDQLMTRPVAVKLISPDPGVDEEVVERFMREAKTTAKIQHPNIVNVFDLGRGDEGDLFFVMERLDGDALSQRLRTKGHLEPELAVHIGAQIADALAHAHNHGIVHRDLKPANVMLVRRGEDQSFVKVLDFGVAKANDQGTQLTRAGVLLGTVEYMAPEQFLGKPADARSDIYAMGILMYRMLTGASPYPDTRVPQIVDYHLNATPAPLASRVSGTYFAPALERVVMRCLAKKPEARYGSMAELASALRGSLLGGTADVIVDDDGPTGSGGGRRADSEHPTINESIDDFDDEAATMMAHSPMHLRAAPGAGALDDQPVTSRDMVPPAPVSRVAAPAPAPPKPGSARSLTGAFSSAVLSPPVAVGLPPSVPGVVPSAVVSSVPVRVGAVTSPSAADATAVMPLSSAAPHTPAQAAQPAVAAQSTENKLPLALGGAALLVLALSGWMLSRGEQVYGLIGAAVGVVLLSAAAVVKALRVL